MNKYTDEEKKGIYKLSCIFNKTIAEIRRCEGFLSLNPSEFEKYETYIEERYKHIGNMNIELYEKYRINLNREECKFGFNVFKFANVKINFKNVEV